MTDDRDRSLAAALLELRAAWDELKRVIWADRWRLALSMGAVWVVVTAVVILTWLL